MRSAILALAAVLACSGCGKNEDAFKELNTTTVTLPDGREIRAELLTQSAAMVRGMMYRDALPQGRGLLFVHEKPGSYSYWMPNTKAPLDIIFMDANRQIVEISADTPPCTTKPADCPVYGGHQIEQFVLELRAGEARRLGLHEGQRLGF